MAVRGRVLRTVVRDCLYLNWAFPLESLPRLPSPLRYEEHQDRDRRCAFGSAILFRHEHLHLAGLPFLRVSYPQFHFRLYVRDHEGVPSVFFWRVLVPKWVVPSARWVGRQPAEAGRFDYPRPSAHVERGQWSWEVRRDGCLRLQARPSSPLLGSGPSLGSWERTVRYFRQRRRAYVQGSQGLRVVETAHRSEALWPIQVAFEDRRLLNSCLGLAAEAKWPDLHSAWLCPEVPYIFELCNDPVRESLRRSTVPAAPGAVMFRSPDSRSRRAAA